MKLIMAAFVSALIPFADARADFNSLTNLPINDCGRVAAIWYAPHSRGYQGPLVRGTMNGGEFKSFNLVVLSTNPVVSPIIWLAIQTNLPVLITNGTHFTETPAAYYGKFVLGSNLTAIPLTAVASNVCDPITNYWVLTLVPPPNTIVPGDNWVAFWFDYECNHHWQVAPTYRMDNEPETYMTCRYPLASGKWGFYCMRMPSWSSGEYPTIPYEIEVVPLPGQENPPTSPTPGVLKVERTGSSNVLLSWTWPYTNPLYLIQMTGTSLVKIPLTNGSAHHVAATNESTFYRLLREP